MDVGLLTIRQEETKKKERKVKVMSMPVLVLEKIFSYLDWKDLSTAMLVCKRWSDVAGHPLLWTDFHLNLNIILDPTGLESLSKIRRLDWVKSVTITPLPGKELENCEDIVQHLTRMEELFVLICANRTALNMYEDFFLKCLPVIKSRLVRICFKSLHLQGYRDIEYFVTSCDAGTNAFIKRTLPPWSGVDLFQSEAPLESNLAMKLWRLYSAQQQIFILEPVSLFVRTLIFQN